MKQANKAVVNLNDLYHLATDSSTANAVRSAATFMLQHPDIYQKIETHDVAGNDGISGRSNFEWAAKIEARSPEQILLESETQEAAENLLAYMQQANKPVVNLKDLYQLSTDASLSDAIREAATFMLQHPDIYQKIETHDVAGADGISGRANFEWAAHGGASQAGTNGISPNVAKAIAAMEQATRDENAINLASTQAKLHAMGMKGAKDIVG